jgi:hypothetical protein
VSIKLMSNTTDAANNWQEPPGISGGMPVTLQMLSTGVGELGQQLLHPLKQLLSFWQNHVTGTPCLQIMALEPPAVMCCVLVCAVPV